MGWDGIGIFKNGRDCAYCEGEIPAVVERMTMLRVCDMVSVSVGFSLVGGLKVMLLGICG